MTTPDPNATPPQNQPGEKETAQRPARARQTGEQPAARRTGENPGVGDKPKQTSASRPDSKPTRQTRTGENAAVNKDRPRTTGTPSKGTDKKPVAILALDRLTEMIKQERHLKVREAILKSLVIRLTNDFEVDKLKAEWVTQEKFVLDQLNVLDDEEWGAIIRELGYTYLPQRQQLATANNREIRMEEIYKINGRSYEFPVWIEGKRPFTRVEALMYRWLQQTNHLNVQRLAARALIRFAEIFDYDENVLLEKRRQQLEADEAALMSEEDETAAKKSWRERAKDFGQWLYMRAVVILSTLLTPGYGKSVGNLLREILTLSTTKKVATDFTLTKWSESDDERTRNLGISLLRAMKFARWIPIIVGGLLFIIFLPIIISLLMVVFAFALVLAFLGFLGNSNQRS